MNPSTTNQRRTRLWIRLAVPLVAAAALTAAFLPGSGSAVALVPPDNNTEPSINGQAIEGRTLTANAGTWSGTTPMTFTYRWLRCPTDGGAADGSNCLVIGGVTTSSYRLRDADVGLAHPRTRDGIRTLTARTRQRRTRRASSRGRRGRTTSRPRASPASPVLGETLTADPGLWSGTQPITFTYQWRTCNRQGGNCQNISGAIVRTYALKQSDVGTTLRVRVTARNSIGSTNITSVPTAVIAASAPTGCPGGNGPVNITQLTPPARLLVDRFQVSPNPIPRSVGALTVGFRVTACGGRPVAGALVYVTAVPYNQFAIPPEQQTGGDGIAILRMDRGRKFPAADNQSLLVMFVRARKGGEPVLAGISTRRLISFKLAK